MQRLKSAYARLGQRSDSSARRCLTTQRPSDEGNLGYYRGHKKKDERGYMGIMENGSYYQDLGYRIQV